MTEKTREKRALVSITEITALVTLISVIVGVAIGVQQFASAVSSAADTLNGLKLQALSEMRMIIDADVHIHQATATYLREKIDDWDTSYALEEVGSGRTGEEIYFSEQLADYREISNHYQVLGATVELGYLPFDLVFEVITFPDRFWERTEELRKAIGDNWQEAGVPLSDFMRSMGSLSDRYQTLRAERGYEHGASQ